MKDGNAAEAAATVDDNLRSLAAITTSTKTIDSIIAFNPFAEQKILDA